MKKITTYLVVCLFGIGFSANAQYYLNEFNPAGENPGGLNTDSENPGDPSYTDIISAAATAPALQWSSVQTIPFTFNFDGAPVTQYKVSNSGVLTFTTSATTVPSNISDTLGTAAIPDKSICVWGIEQGAGNDAITKKTFGTAPNRQHWIYFASFTGPNGATNTAQGHWTYWGIVLEESTDNIYIVDMRTFNIELDLTIGIQIDANNTIAVAGAPNTPSFVTNGGNAADATDNVYYEFIQGVRPLNDVALSSIDNIELVEEGSSVTISGEFFNNGENALDSVFVVWSTDGGTTVNRELQTGFNLSTLQSQTFTHGTTITAADPGTFTNVEVWVELPSSKTDGDLSNDSSSFEFFVNSGQTVSRSALFEEFTTAPCQFCPDGAVVADYIIDNVPEAVVVGVHACFGTDAMTIPEASELCSTIGSGSAPAGIVDRVLFDGESSPAFGRGPLSGQYTPANSGWTVRTQQRIALGSPLTIEMDGDYSDATKMLNVDVKSSFVDYPLPGDISVSLMIVEDSVTGSTCVLSPQFGPSNYCQINAYNTQTGHPYAGAGNPIINYVHKKVLRDVLPSTFGDNSVIPSSVALNTEYIRNFSIDLSDATVGLSSNFEASRISIVAVVAYSGPDVDSYEVINAKEYTLEELNSVGISENANSNASLNIYPNPSNNIANVSIDLKESNNVQLDVMDITGKVISSDNLGVMAKGNQLIRLNVADFANGFYFMNLRVGDEMITRKFTVAK
ncbi:MAG: T9SS type A sorting domain-containing protein [Vicingaceae bacterium]